MITDKLGSKLEVGDEVLVSYKNKLVKVSITRFHKEYAVLRMNPYVCISARAKNTFKI